jgi:hypothetical protein
MAHKCFSLLVPDDAFPDGRNKFKTSNPLLVIRGHLAAAFSRYTVPPPPNEGGGAAAEDAGEGCHKGPVGRLIYKLIQKKYLELKNNYFKLTHFCPKPFQSIPSVPTQKYITYI